MDSVSAGPVTQAVPESEVQTPERTPGSSGSRWPRSIDLPRDIFEPMGLSLEDGSADHPLVKMTASDGTSVVVLPAVLGYFEMYDEDFGGVNNVEHGTVITLPAFITGLVLQKMIRWCEVHYRYVERAYSTGHDPNLQHSLIFWITLFFDIHHKFLSDLFESARYLRCMKFLHAMRKELAGPTAYMMENGSVHSDWDLI